MEHRSQNAMWENEYFVNVGKKFLIYKAYAILQSIFHPPFHAFEFWIRNMVYCSYFFPENLISNPCFNFGKETPQSD